MKMSIRLKILLPSLAILFIGLFSLYLIATYNGKAMLTADMESATRSSVDRFTSQSLDRTHEVEIMEKFLNDGYIQLAKMLAATIAADPAVLAPEKIASLAEEVGVAEIHVTDENGILRWGTFSDFYGFDFASTEQSRVFMAALTEPSFSHAQEAQARGADGVFFQYIGVARQDKKGIIQIGVDATFIQKEMESLSLQNLLSKFQVDDYGGYGFVVDLSGNFFAHPDPDYIGTDVHDFDWGEKLFHGKEGHFYYSFEDREKYLFYELVGDKIYCGSIYVAPYLAPISILQTSLLIASAVAGLFMAILILIIVNVGVLNPLKKLQEKITILAEGEGDLTQEVVIRNRDELGDLASGINAFMVSLRGIVGNVKSSSNEAEHMSALLQTNAEESSTAVGQIGGNVGEISSRIGVLDEKIAGSAGMVKEIEVNISDLNIQIEGQSSAVEESTASVNEMVASLQSVAAITDTKRQATERLVDTTRQGGDKVIHMNQVVETIFGSVEKITEMITVINDIASQTDLLSMNAAIEAAHAGDAGRGFSVVAEEIRKLSESTRENAKAINDVLSGIGSQVKEASQVSKETNQAFGEINGEVISVSQALAEINSSTQELSLGGVQILEAMQLLQDISLRVREGSEEMSQGAKGMGSAIGTVQDISGEVHSLVQEISNGSKVISERTNTVAQLTSEMANNAASLNEEINRFKTE